eukprot:4605247-Ditylum_brightwellii.AAC.1
MPNHGEVWFHRDGIANILALHDIRKTFRVTYDSDEGSYFMVHKSTYDMRYNKSNSGLYYHDAVDPAVSLFIMTVEGNKQWFTCQQYKVAV